MKNYKYIFLGIFTVCAFCFKGFAQNLTDENTEIINRYFKSTTIMQQKPATPTNVVPTTQSVVKITQVGNYNVADVTVGAGQSQTVNQNGNSNYYSFIKYFNNNPSNFNVLQQGEANSLQIYGQNSLINNISILQKGDFKSLIIKNY